jgi:hypothetical protein
MYVRAEKRSVRGVRNPHFLFDGFGIVATGGGSRSGSDLNENTGRAQD